MKNSSQQNKRLNIKNKLLKLEKRWRTKHQRIKNREVLSDIFSKPLVPLPRSKKTFNQRPIHSPKLRNSQQLLIIYLLQIWIGLKKRK